MPMPNNRHEKSLLLFYASTLEVNSGLCVREPCHNSQIYSCGSSLDAHNENY